MFRTFALAVAFGTLTLSAQSQDAAAPAVDITVPATPAAVSTPEAAAPPVPGAATPATPPEAEVKSIEPAPEATPKPTPNVSIEIDLQQQRAYLIRDGRKMAESPISSGRAGHLTPAGDFAVIQKDLNHFSNLYGSIVDRSGRVVIAGADAAMAVPRGCHFKPAAMKNFLRFEGAAGMHAGILPGYPASHGCVRMPADKARLFYQTAQLGSPVHVFGKTPTRARSERSSTVRLAKAEREGRTTPRVNPAPMPPQQLPLRPPVRRGWFPFFHRY